MISDAVPDDCAIRFLVAELARLRGAFKPPSLRNVTQTPPYMHAGQLSSLAEVLRHYDRAPPAAIGRKELHPLHLDDDQLEWLAAFLETLESPVVAPPDFLVPAREERAAPRRGPANAHR